MMTSRLKKDACTHMRAPEQHSIVPNFVGMHQEKLEYLMA